MRRKFIKQVGLGVLGMCILPKITARFISLKELTMWHDKLHNLTQVDWDYIDMTEEEDLLSELAKLMTLMNMFQEDEEYEKCAIIKGRMAQVNKILKKGKK